MRIYFNRKCLVYLIIVQFSIFSAFQLYRAMNQCTSSFMEIWRSPKPVVAKIKRVAIGGGSDIALACDVTFTEDSCRIGYPPSNAKNLP